MKWSVKNRRADFRVRNDSRRRRVRLDRLEALESRQLLTTPSYTFVAPDLSTLEHQANPTAAMFNRLVGSLQAQIVLGPLSALQSIGGATTQTINGNQYVAAVANMVQGFEAAATQQEPSNQTLDHLVLLQGAALDAQTVALNAKRNDGVPLAASPPPLTDTASPGNTSPFYNANLTTVEHLTLSRPLWPYGTPILDYINRTELFETDLGNAAGIISTKGIAAAANLAQIEAASFTADINLSTLQRPGLDTFMNQQVGTLLTQINAAAQSGPSGAAAFAAAVQSFTTATYDQTTGAGYLGPRGAYGRYFVQPTTTNQVPSEAYANVSPSLKPPNFYSTGNTFAYGRYKAKQLHKTTTYHRNFAGAPTVKGSYVTTVLYPNSAVAIRKSALDQTFLPPPTNYNTSPSSPAFYGDGLPNAFYVEDVEVPASHWVFVGRVAPIYQGVLTPRNTLYPGLAPQIVIDNFLASNVSYVNLRTTGT
jgi:hypothetical protein